MSSTASFPQTVDAIGALCVLLDMGSDPASMDDILLRARSRIAEIDFEPASPDPVGMDRLEQDLLSMLIDRVER